MFSKSSLLSFVTLALGASSVMAASIPHRRAQEEFQLNRRADTNGYVSIGYFVNWGIYARNFRASQPQLLQFRMIAILINAHRAGRHQGR